MARCYRQFFKNAPEAGRFVKERFEVSAYCNSRFATNELNIIIRVKSALTAAIEKHLKLPKYLVIVLEEDVIEYARFQGPGISGILGRYLEGLASEINHIIHIRLEQLPLKAKMQGEYPVIYWVAAVSHKLLTNRDLRAKFNLCLESIIKKFDNMRVIKIKEIWNYDDQFLVSNGALTPTGLSTYWKAVDSSIHFNVKRNEKSNGKFKKATSNGLGKKTPPMTPEQDFVKGFFKRNKQNRDRFCWRKSDMQYKKLPQPPSPTTVVTVHNNVN